MGCIRVAAFVGWAVATCAGCAACATRVAPPSPPREPERVAMPGPGRGGGRAAVDANAACEGCHAEVAAEWRGSMHRRAAIDPVYQRGLAVEPDAFCRACHAPEADPTAETPATLADLGVGCVTCHDTGAGVLAGPVSGAPRRGDVAAPHAQVRAADFATARACERCHDFRFPAGPHAEKMQSTLVEAARAPVADRACASCHMPIVGEPGHAHRAHGFHVLADTVREAAVVTVTRHGSAARVWLQPGAVGHAFPTGDMFRRLEISVAAIGPDDAVVAEKLRYLARHFGVARAGGRAVLRDDRVGLRGPEPTVVDVDLGPAAIGRALAVRLAYQRTENPATNDEPDATVAEEIVLASTVLPPEVR